MQMTSRNQYLKALIYTEYFLKIFLKKVKLKKRTIYVAEV
jgi:hypothetical protein